MTDRKTASNRSPAVGAATDSCPRCGSARIGNGVCAVCGANLAEVLNQLAAGARRAGLGALTEPVAPGGRQPVPRAAPPATATRGKAGGRRGRPSANGHPDPRRSGSLLLPLALGGAGGALVLVTLLVLLLPTPEPDPAPMAAREAQAPRAPNVDTGSPVPGAELGGLASETAAALTEWSRANGPALSAAALPGAAPLPGAPGAGAHTEARPLPGATGSALPALGAGLDLDAVRSAGPAGAQATLGAYQRAHEQAARELAALDGGSSGWTASQGPSDDEIGTLRQLAADGDDIAILTLRAIARQRRLPPDSLLPPAALAPQR